MSQIFASGGPSIGASSFSISPSNEYLGLISFRMDWLDLHAVQGTVKSLLQHHSSKASILLCSAFFIVQLSCPLSRGYHPTISSSVAPFSCSQSFPASGSFLKSWLFASGGQSIGASASAPVLPENIQDWFSLGWTVYLVGTQLLLNGWGNTLNPSVLKYIPYHSLSTTHA